MVGTMNPLEGNPSRAGRKSALERKPGVGKPIANGFR